MALIEVIKYNGDRENLVWKFPSEEIGTWTQLVVNESQEAVLVKGGKICDVFQAGTHTLSTANIPVLNKIINLPFGGKSPFTAEVWYINKTNILDIKWGTATPIQIQDPKYGLFVPVRAHGQFGVIVSDAQMFLKKIVGTLTSFSKEDLVEYFRGIYLTKVKDIIATNISKGKISIIEINAYLEEISAAIKESFGEELKNYGVDIENFNVNDISVKEDDPQVLKLKEALAKKAEMDILGYSYKEERTFDTLEGAAKNEGSSASSIMGAGIGMGVGFGIGDKMKETMQSTMTTQSPVEEVKEKANENVCDKCGTKNLPSAKFCIECGDPMGEACVKCGARLKGGEKFCSECGSKQVLVCKKCGKELESGAKFCLECGEKQ